jgi:3-dehydroquinate dehydratase-1/3-dehydroquinate dehydratase/shikimate dehydrogenase
LQVPLDSPAGICVSIACENETEAFDLAKQSEANADIIEIRLDRLARPDVDPFVKGLSKPLLFTNRPEWEGGAFKGSEVDRVGLLLKAVENDCSLVDLELKTAQELRAELLDVLIKHPQTGLIISWHDGAHVGKIVTMANSYEDVLKVLNLQTIATENNFPLIFFCMGRMGMVSRLATLRLGGFMTYAAPDGGDESAPGQMKVSTLRTMMKKLASTE